MSDFNALAAELAARLENKTTPVVTAAAPAHGTPGARPTFDEIMAKSMTLTDANGEKVDAVDATELMEALNEDNKELRKSLDASTATIKEIGDLVTAQHSALVKMLDDRAADQQMIKSLQETVERIGAKPAGRVAALTLHDKPGARPAAGQGEPSVTPNMLKSMAMAAFGKGRIGAGDVARVESYANEGQMPPPDLLRTIMPEQA